MTGNELIATARALAEKVHDGQTRKNKAKLPAISHMQEVAELVEKSGGTPMEIAAAWLHDTVEDTELTLADISAQFGAEVAEIVDGLTDPPEYKGRPLLRRKIDQAARIDGEIDSVKKIKIADQTSNVRSIAEDPPVSWDKYKCLEYALGAYLIVRKCVYVNAYLRHEFMQAYEKALAAHS